MGGGASARGGLQHRVEDLLRDLQDLGGGLEPLLIHLPQGPFVVRETPASLLPALKKRVPNAKIYLEQRMIVEESTFLPAPKLGVRQVTEDDLLSLDSPPDAPQR